MSGRAAAAVEEAELALDRIPIPGSPGFYRRGKWVVFPYRDRRGRQRWGKGSTLVEARRAKAAIVTDVARGEHRPLAKVGFTTYARECMGSYQGRTSKQVDPLTRADYVARLEQDAVGFFGETPIGALEPKDIKAFCAHVAARGPVCRSCRGREDKRRSCAACEGSGRRPGKVSANTVRLALAPVKVVLATAFEDGVIRVNPAAGVRVLTPRPRDVDLDDDEAGPVKAMTEAEVAAFFAAVAGKKTWARWILMFRLLLELGLRIGELVELRWRDVDLGSHTVKVRRGFYRGRVGPPKTKFGRRTLRLTGSAKAHLERLRAETRAGDGDLVLTNARGGRVDASNLMRDVLKPAGREAGVGEWVGFHTFRHTCATLLFTKAKWNPKQVQLWLGHHSAAFTVDRYVHLLPADLPPAVELAGAPQLRLIDGGRNEGVTERHAQARNQRPLAAADLA
jgi:integrase